ncbi:uncharacterized protein LOC142332910 [Lycorma delicatula]|uniref:uncharacterized protein LOC142332910 n=1 Tax=Lycorma delicatula TaxID=130591 RepID=UPI003F5173EE
MMKYCVFFSILFLLKQFSATQVLPTTQLGFGGNVSGKPNVNENYVNNRFNPFRDVGNIFRGYNDAALSAYANTRPNLENLQKGIGNFVAKPVSSLLTPLGMGALPNSLANTGQYVTQSLMDAGAKTTYDVGNALLNGMETVTTPVVGYANTASDLLNNGLEQGAKAGMIAANILGSSGKLLADMGAQTIKTGLNTATNLASNLTKYPGGMFNLPNGGIDANAAGSTGGLLAGTGESAIKAGINAGSNLAETAANSLTNPGNMNNLPNSALKESTNTAINVLKSIANLTDDQVEKLLKAGLNLEKLFGDVGMNTANSANNASAGVKADATVSIPDSGNANTTV